MWCSKLYCRNFRQLVTIIIDRFNQVGCIFVSIHWGGVVVFERRVTIFDAEFGESIAMTAEKYGIYFEKSDKKRIPGWMQCHYRLMFDNEGYPMFYVFNTCKEFIRTIPTLQYDEHEDEDLDTHGEDHAADEWRYICMKFLITPEPEKIENLPMFGADPLNQYGGKYGW